MQRDAHPRRGEVSDSGESRIRQSVSRGEMGSRVEGWREEETEPLQAGLRV